LFSDITHSTRSKYSIYDAGIEDWKDILNLADKWDFPEVKELAVRELHKKSDLDVVSKLALYREYNVDRRHLVPLYAILCKRPSSLTREEARILGLDTTVLISAARQTLRAKPSDGGLFPLPAGIDEEDIFRALESSLELEAALTKKENVTSPPTSGRWLLCFFTCLPYTDPHHGVSSPTAYKPR
jgi:hypothetical protein